MVVVLRDTSWINRSHKSRTKCAVAMICIFIMGLIPALGMFFCVRKYYVQEVQPVKIQGVEYSRDGHSRSRPKITSVVNSTYTSRVGIGSNDKILDILNGELTLVDLRIPNGFISKDVSSTSKSGTYRGIQGKFCKLNWELYKSDPPSLPMYHSLISASNCDQTKIWVDMSTIVKKARKYDEMYPEHKNEHPYGPDVYVHSLRTSGFVFHESRVGSTLAANSLVAMDPVKHRVYSEASPITTSLMACNEIERHCDMNANVELVRDVVYLMGRSNNPLEQHQFFKVSSVGSKSIGLFRKAFPDIPWIFIYRDPVQTMMSHMDPEKLKRSKGAVCLRSMRKPTADLIDLVSRTGKDISKLTKEEFCAAHLATLCESALREIQKSSKGKPVEYSGLVDKLIEYVIPVHFDIRVGDVERRRILEVSSIYSKSKSKSKEWIEDSEIKEKRATTRIQDASKIFLEKSYLALRTHTA